MKTIEITTYLSENRNEIIDKLQREIKRKLTVCGKTATDLKGAMIVFKNTLESTGNIHAANKASIDAINGKIKASKYAHLSESAQRQMPSSWR